MPYQPKPLVQPPASGSGVEPGRVAGLAKMEAENLLDWLEAQGCRYRAVAYKEGQGFVVRYSKEPRGGSELRGRSRTGRPIRPWPCGVQPPGSREETSPGWGWFEGLRHDRLPGSSR
jgi:hypothetical protein